MTTSYPSWLGLEPLLDELTSQQRELLESSRTRIDSDLPKDTHVMEQVFAEMIKVDRKTLKNDRTPSGPGRYPVAIRYGGSRLVSYLRHDVVDWLAYQQMRARMRRIHRCR